MSKQKHPKASELREKTCEELSQVVFDARAALHSVQFARSDRTLKRHADLKETKHFVARVLTIMREKGCQNMKNNIQQASE